MNRARLAGRRGPPEARESNTGEYSACPSGLAARMSSRPLRRNAAVSVIESSRRRTLGRTCCRAGRRCTTGEALAIRTRSSRCALSTSSRCRARAMPSSTSSEMPRMSFMPATLARLGRPPGGREALAVPLTAASPSRRRPVVAWRCRRDAVAGCAPGRRGQAPHGKNVLMSTHMVASGRRVSPGVRDVSRPGFTLAAAVLGFFVVTLDATVVNVALPSVRADFGGGISGLQWVAAGYTLMFAALLLSAGAMADRIGARRAVGAGGAGFVLASAACGLAPGLGVLVAARLVQGAAAAVMMPSSMALIGQAFPDPARRARAVAMWAMGGAIASSAGPVTGGLLTLASWRLIFFINVPAGAAALVLLARTAPSPRRPAPFDWAGQVTAVLAMGGLTYGAIEAGTAGLTAPRVLAAFAVAVAGLAVFLASQARGAHPMAP